MDEPLVRAHASAEFLLKQFELDIDRASWVVETAMEWHLINRQKYLRRCSKVSLAIFSPTEVILCRHRRG
jgi:hypothetical protein